MKKWIAILATAVFMLCFIPFSVTASAASLTKVTFNDVAARKGDTIEITVNLTDCQAFKSMAVVPLYDSDKLEYISGEWLISGALLSDWSQEEQNGVILYSSEIIINGEIAKFVFRLTDNSSWDDIDFSCKVVLKNGNSEIDVEVDTLKIFIICDHVWGEEIYTIHSSCTEEGYTYKICAICNRAEIISEIEKTAHRPSEWIVDREATLYEKGLQHKECLDCHEVLEQELIPMLGQCDHIWGDEVFVIKSTCTEVGYIYRVCTICGDRDIIAEIEKIQHTPSDWIIDSQATIHEAGQRHKECLACCEILDQEVIPVLEHLDHIWGDEVFVEEATFSEHGVVYQICSICGEHNTLYELDKRGIDLFITITIAVGSAVGVGLTVLIVCLLIFRKNRKLR